jgi:DUF4097 and DUF4098 domain-containing protein YvlB
VAEGITIESDDEGVEISVEIPDEWVRSKGDHADLRADLEIQVPRGSHVGVESLNAAVSVRDVTGSVGVEAVNGAIDVRGGDRVEIESMTGAIVVDTTASAIRIESISGRVEVRGARENVDVATVSAPIVIEGGPFEEVDVESTSGAVRIAGPLAHGGTVSVETFSGDVILAFPPAVKARFEIATFSGEIRNAFGPSAPPDEDFDPHRELHFSLGLDGATVGIETFSGNVSLEKQGAR